MAIEYLLSYHEENEFVDYKAPLEQYILVVDSEENSHGDKVRKIVGTRNAPFRTSEVSLTEQMEDGVLHLYSPSETRALPLLPFIKVMPSPKTEENACYFYNRRRGSDIRYLSYHFDSDSEVIAAFDDVSHALEAITGLSGFE